MDAAAALLWQPYRAASAPGWPHGVQWPAMASQSRLPEGPPLWHRPHFPDRGGGLCASPPTENHGEDTTCMTPKGPPHGALAELAPPPTSLLAFCSLAGGRLLAGGGGGGGGGGLPWSPTLHPSSSAQGHCGRPGSLSGLAPPPCWLSAHGEWRGKTAFWGGGGGGGGGGPSPPLVLFTRPLWASWCPVRHCPPPPSWFCAHGWVASGILGGGGGS